MTTYGGSDNKASALAIIQGSVDSVQLDILKQENQSFETANFKLINAEAKILK